MSHDSNATPPTAWTLWQHAPGHVPEARAHDIAVSHRSGNQRKWRHAADADAPSAAAASSGPRVSHDFIQEGGVVLGGTEGMMGKVL